MDRRVVRIVTLASLAVLVICASSGAVVPAEITLQGRLTDPTGTPVAPGTKTFTFKVFNASTAGTEVWPMGLGETQSVATDANGNWTARLGKITPLSNAVFSDSSRWLQVTVYDGVNPPEILSRIKLNVAPYSFRVGTVDGAQGGLISSATTVPSLSIGAASASNGTLDIYGAGSSSHTLAIDNVTAGGRLTCYNATGSGQAAQIVADADGSGGYLTVNRGTSTAGFTVDGNAAGSGNPVVTVQGSTSTATIDTRVTGDASVQLPAGSISASEIASEPGISASTGVASVALDTVAMADIGTVTITTPEAGYIVVDATAYIDCAGTTGSNYAKLQIDETSGGTSAAPYAIFAGQTAYAGAGSNWFPVHVTRNYFKAAGTYTFRLEGMKAEPGSLGTITATDPSIRAAYYPTSYGSVTATAPTATETGYAR